jgi:hypothetical protein
MLFYLITHQPVVTWLCQDIRKPRRYHSSKSPTVHASDFDYMCYSPLAKHHQAPNLYIPKENTVLCHANWHTRYTAITTSVPVVHGLGSSQRQPAGHFVVDSSSSFSQFQYRFDREIAMYNTPSCLFLLIYAQKLPSGILNDQQKNKRDKLPGLYSVFYLFRLSAYAGQTATLFSYNIL